MQQNTITLYYNRRGKVFYDPYNANRQLWGVSFPRLDNVRVRVAVTDGFARVDSNGKPVVAAYIGLSEWTSCVLAFKTPHNVALDGDLSFSSSGFDTSDSAWHNLAQDRFTIGTAVVPTSLCSTEYQMDVTLLQTNWRWWLNQEVVAFVADVQAPAYVGDEPSAPSGVPVIVKGNFAISGTATEAIIDIAGFTATGQIFVALLPPTGDPGDTVFTVDTSYATAHPGKCRVYVFAAPGAGNAFNGAWQLGSLS